MKIKARCHPKLESILPKPYAASGNLPEWFREMPSKVEAASLGGQEIRTLKHCVPFIDAMSAGILIPLASDLHVRDGELSWDWNPPVLEDSSISRSPVGIHVPEQGEGAPFNKNGRLIIKFMNFWTLETTGEWQLIFTHPFNRSDLPFNTLSGTVNCHAFKNGYVHFPALLNEAFEGTISAGTPVAQVVAVPKAAVEMDVGTMTSVEIEENRLLQEELQRETGVYRKSLKL